MSSSRASVRYDYGHVRCKAHAWYSAEVIPGKNPDVYRRDSMGNVIYYKNYGKYTDMGWHIDHIKPQAAGGAHHYKNLQALQAKANIKKSDKYPGHKR
jgi:5-methylcytosine-specific restriction endonuclease McrA